MEKRTLGTNGVEGSAVGPGCMSMTGGYSDKPDRNEMISLIRAAVDRGVTFFDTAEISTTSTAWTPTYPSKRSRVRSRN
ncbi:hypothetical protein GCM10023063_36130 [Arthrobacter methylotrophus]|uniref:Aldo/keto reductase n=1 Tax=Arthrobacter methylotrophus TaxID=121291 RepID=A0ABV5UMQ0_9MICC